MTVKLKASSEFYENSGQCLINFIFLSQKFSVHSAPHYEEQSGPKTHGFRSCRFTKNYLITIHMHSGKMTTPLPLFSILFWIPIYGNVELIVYSKCLKVSLCAFIFFRYFGKGKKKINENLKKKKPKKLKLNKNLKVLQFLKIFQFRSDPMKSCRSFLR